MHNRAAYAFISGLAVDKKAEAHVSQSGGRFMRRKWEEASSKILSCSRLGGYAKTASQSGAHLFAGLRVMLDIRLIFEARDVIKLPALIRVKYPIIYMKYIFGGINNGN